MAHGRGTTQLIHDPRPQQDHRNHVCVRVCFHPIFTPGSDSCWRFRSCSNFVRSTPPRQDGAARACRDPPRWVLEGGIPARAAPGHAATKHCTSRQFVTDVRTIFILPTGQFDIRFIS
jgi:hypothetical protein